MRTSNSITPEQPTRNKITAKRKKKRFLIAGILVLVIVIAIVVIRGKEKETELGKTKVAKSISAVTIGDDATTSAKLNKTLKITSDKQAKLYAEYSGRIVEASFNVGDQVKAGQVLAKFDQSDNDNTTVVGVNAAEKNVSFAHENLEKTRESTEKDIKIAKNNVEIARIALEEAESEGDTQGIETAEETLEQAKRQRDKTKILAKQQIENAQNTLDQAEASLQNAVIAHNKTVITAPISGTVTDKSITSSSYLTAGSQIATISTNKDLQSTIYLTEQEIEGLKVGDEVKVSCLGSENINLDSFTPSPAVIDSISNIPNPGNLRYALTLKFNQTGLGCIQTNSFVKAEFDIPASSTPGHYFLPLEAVKLGQSRNIVFVIDNENRAHAREVQTGQVFGQYVEITQGLQVGDVVATEGSRNLQDQDKVTFPQAALQVKDSVSLNQPVLNLISNQNNSAEEIF